MKYTQEQIDKAIYDLLRKFQSKGLIFASSATDFSNELNRIAAFEIVSRVYIENIGFCNYSYITDKTEYRFNLSRSINPYDDSTFSITDAGFEFMDKYNSIAEHTI